MLKQELVKELFFWWQYLLDFIFLCVCVLYVVLDMILSFPFNLAEDGVCSILHIDLLYYLCADIAQISGILFCWNHLC